MCLEDKNSKLTYTKKIKFGWKVVRLFQKEKYDRWHPLYHNKDCQYKFNKWIIDDQNVGFHLFKTRKEARLYKKGELYYNSNGYYRVIKCYFKKPLKEGIELGVYISRARAFTAKEIFMEK